MVEKGWYSYRPEETLNKYNIAVKNYKLATYAIIMTVKKLLKLEYARLKKSIKDK